MADNYTSESYIYTNIFYNQETGQYAPLALIANQATIESDSSGNYYLSYYEGSINNAGTYDVTAHEHVSIGQFPSTAAAIEALEQRDFSFVGYIKTDTPFYTSNTDLTGQPLTNTRETASNDLMSKYGFTSTNSAAAIAKAAANNQIESVPTTNLDAINAAAREQYQGLQGTNQPSSSPQSSSTSSQPAVEPVPVESVPKTDNQPQSQPKSKPPIPNSPNVLEEINREAELPVEKPVDAPVKTDKQANISIDSPQLQPETPKETKETVKVKINPDLIRSEVTSGNQANPSPVNTTPSEPASPTLSSFDPKVAAGLSGPSFNSSESNNDSKITLSTNQGTITIKDPVKAAQDAYHQKEVNNSVAQAGQDIDITSGYKFDFNASTGQVPEDPHIAQIEDLNKEVDKYRDLYGYASADRDRAYKSSEYWYNENQETLKKWEEDAAVLIEEKNAAQAEADKNRAGWDNASAGWERSAEAAAMWFGEYQGAVANYQVYEDIITDKDATMVEMAQYHDQAMSEMAYAHSQEVNELIDLNTKISTENVNLHVENQNLSAENEDLHARFDRLAPYEDNLNFIADYEERIAIEDEATRQTTRALTLRDNGKNTPIVKLIDSGADAQVNLFEVSIYAGKKQTEFSSTDKTELHKNLTFRITAFNAPEKQLQIQDLVYQAGSFPKVMVSSGLTRQLDFTVRIDSNYEIYWFMHEIYAGDSTGNFDLNLFKSTNTDNPYLSKITVKALKPNPMLVLSDSDDHYQTTDGYDVIYSWTFSDCILTKIPQVALDMGNSGPITGVYSFKFGAMHEGLGLRGLDSFTDTETHFSVMTRDSLLEESRDSFTINTAVNTSAGGATSAIAATAMG